MDNGRTTKNTNLGNLMIITIPFNFFIYQPYLFIWEKS